MSKVLHLIGNGDNATMYKQGTKGIKLICNLPPFPVEGAWATCMVDFKMMKAISEGSVNVPGNWVCGFRPKKWCEMKPEFYMKHASKIRTFYLTKPDYVKNYTDFNCGHFAAHYGATTFKPDEIHMYGFDSLFDMNLRSCTDFYLNSDRGAPNNVRLNDNWRPIWKGIFEEFADTQFVLYHKHDKIKFKVPENVEIRTKTSVQA